MYIDVILSKINLSLRFMIVPWDSSLFVSYTATLAFLIAIKCGQLLIERTSSSAPSSLWNVKYCKTNALDDHSVPPHHRAWWCHHTNIITRDY